MWEAVCQAAEDEPVTIWLLGGGCDAMYRWLSVGQFVFQDGHTYKTPEAYQKLKEACRILPNKSLAAWAFRVKSHSQHCSQRAQWLKANFSQSPR